MHSTLLVILVWMINQWCWGYLLDRGNVSFTFYLIFLTFIFKWSCGLLYCTKGGSCYSRGSPVAEGTVCGIRKVSRYRVNCIKWNARLEVAVCLWPNGPRALNQSLFWFPYHETISNIATSPRIKCRKAFVGQNPAIFRLPCLYTLKSYVKAGGLYNFIRGLVYVGL